MPNCAICKKSVTTGIVLCGHCAKGLAPYTLSTDLAWFIDQLSEEIVLNHAIYACAMCAVPTCASQVMPQRYQGVAAEAGGAILPRKGGVMEGHDERKHLIQALDRVSLF